MLLNTPEIIFKKYPSENYKELCNDYLNKKVNKDIEDRLPHFTPMGFDKLDILVFVEVATKKIIAATGIKPYTHDNDIIECWFIAVDKDYRRLGLGSRLIREQFKFIEEKYPGKMFKVSSFTEMGNLFIKPVLIKISKDFPKITLLK